jgi:hypothetical protein
MTLLRSVRSSDQGFGAGAGAAGAGALGAGAGAAGAGATFAATGAGTGFGTGGGAVTLGTATWTAAVPASTGEPLAINPRTAPKNTSPVSALAVDALLMRRVFLCCL